MVGSGACWIVVCSSSRGMLVDLWWHLAIVCRGFKGSFPTAPKAPLDYYHVRLSGKGISLTRSGNHAEVYKT